MIQPITRIYDKNFNEIAVESVTCSFCKAEVGKPCDWNGTSGRAVGSHWSRIAAFLGVES